MTSDLKTFPSIRAMARYLKMDEATLRNRMGRKRKVGAKGQRGPAMPMILSNLPASLEDRVEIMDKRLVEVLVRLDGVQRSLRELVAKLADEDL